MLLVEQETKIGLSLGWVFSWVYPIKSTGYVRGCLNPRKDDLRHYQHMSLN